MNFLMNYKFYLTNLALLETFNPGIFMIEKVLKIQSLDEHKNTAMKEDRDYWLSRSPDERISAVEFLRKQFYANTTRLQRSARVIKHSQS
jgi:hypothetical protein